MADIKKKATKKTGFDAPVYGMTLKKGEKLVKGADGLYKIVKDTKKK